MVTVILLQRISPEKYDRNRANKMRQGTMIMWDLGGQWEYRDLDGQIQEPQLVAVAKGSNLCAGHQLVVNLSEERLRAAHQPQQAVL
eukprot:scaffold220361_cov33-Prasinocladus_malaysianus.AAC.2